MTFSTAEVGAHPVSITKVWPDTLAVKNNPNAVFQGGVVRLAKEDFDRIMQLGRESSKVQQGKAFEVPTAASGIPAADEVFATAQRVKGYVNDHLSPGLSEDATRAHFINKLLESLGYQSFGDVDYGVPVDSGDVADYVLKVMGRPSRVSRQRSLAHHSAQRKPPKW